PIASVTKLMTSLVVFDLKETYNLNQIIKISKEAVSQEGDSRWGGLKVGENLSVKNLLYMALIESNNDAAFALTEPVGEKAFVDLMNLNARKIGLKNTRFFNPTGLEPDDLSDPINYSSAYDLARLAEYILNNYPKIFEITENESISILKPDGSLHHFIPENTNRLLEVVPGVIGGKTGWAPRASGCLVLVIKNPKKDGCFINVVLGSRDRFGDMKKIIEALGVKIKK
ncbi:MAG TPA: D-alanyl-D-alanine carboxypeptidase, partial [Candidatus Parcubacteria bacterium]|nr:D-alanyl-D-alanine carboxypeptidase [Candidatus Parcubacteria bacterium]